MTDKPTFVSQVLAGEAARADADDWIAAWHLRASDDGIPLHDFLGMTWDEFAEYGRDASSLDRILAARGWTTPDVADTSLFRISHDVGSERQISSFQNATLTTVGDMAVSIAVTAPDGLDYRQTRVVNDLFRAAMRRLVDVGCRVEIRIGPDAGQRDERAAVDAILRLRGEEAVRG